MNDQRTDREGGGIVHRLPTTERVLASIALAFASLLAVPIVRICPDDALGGLCAGITISIAGGLLGAGLFNPFKAAAVGAFAGFWTVVVFSTLR